MMNDTYIDIIDLKMSIFLFALYSRLILLIHVLLIIIKITERSSNVLFSSLITLKYNGAWNDMKIENTFLCGYTKI